MSEVANLFKSVLKNPLSDYLRFTANWGRNKLRYKNYYQGYMSLVVNSKIAPNVSIYNRVGIGDSSIDSYTYVYDNTRIFKAVIGKFCCIGPNCIFRLGLHPSKDFVSSHPIFYSTKKQVGLTFADRDYFEEEKIVAVGNDVWVGANAIVLDGVTIGDGAIIAAGAVVTKDVPPYAIYGGIPAKLIRYRFDDEKTREFLVKLKWWDKDEEWLISNFKDFHSIDNFMKKYGVLSAEDSAQYPPD